MKTFLFLSLKGLFFLTINANGFSGTPKQEVPQKKQKLSVEAVEGKARCPQVFFTSGNEFQNFLKDYAKFGCFPLLTTESIIKNHPDKPWALEALTKENSNKILSPQEELRLKVYLYPFIKNRNLKERSLLDQIALRAQLGLDNKDQVKTLYQNFPSHDPKFIKNPNLKYVKDLRRRGLDTQALVALKKLKRRYPNGDKVNKQLIATQKNIKRDETFLRYSQEYTDIVYRRYQRNKRHKWKRREYLKQGLLNIRRIWTYRSTDEAERRLITMIKYHCRYNSECAEHYWIMGRIQEEKSNYKEARRWLVKAINSTSIKSSEYKNRLWNLVWLESKSVSSEQAMLTAKAHINKMDEKEVSSKLYYWMSRWAKTEKEKNKYVELIKVHHPLSFYLWSPLALGEGIKLKKNTPKVKVKSTYEKELMTLTGSNFPNLTRAYIRATEKKDDFKRSMSWKKLKALNGMYSDLLLDMEAKNISPKTHMIYLFSTKYRPIIEKKAIANRIPKELVWSIIRQESNFNPFARSWADAFGLMQVLEKRALSYLEEEQNLNKNGLSPIEMFDPSFNISVGTWLLKSNLQKFQGRLPLAIAAYNANEGKVKQWEDRFYKGDFLPMIEEITYRETRKYVKLVLRNMEVYSQLTD